MFDIAENIKNLRIKTTLSQNRFGLKLGISGKTVSAYETGKCIPPLHVLEKISQVYNVSIATITNPKEDVLINKIRNLQRELEEITKLISY